MDTTQNLYEPVNENCRAAELRWRYRLLCLDILIEIALHLGIGPDVWSSWRAVQRELFRQLQHSPRSDR